ncbi:malonic semialdehyde reductase [Denitromonas halophila]|uniref:Putative NADH dehydrogenase/NAD(P)H nitroreductase FHP91_03510 n=1 Tax=Denitromonas halophila TaxID=1629404 RepID=A0A557R0Q7_9RHOO|nr:malonic semialdehyde reductase [Denitromonas halophila]TVO58741.1 malonic semialdehyde reductase [Denitromonas halophila]
MTGVSPDVLDQAFRAARTFNAFSGKEVPDALLRELYELLKWGPTSMNCQPARYVFVKSEAAKARLAPALAQGNVAKTMAAPVTVIVATDTRFHEHLVTQFPANAKAGEMFAGNTALAESTAFRNGTLQGGYLILAARLLGLDCGPMSGFNADTLNAEFFPDGRYTANFLVNLGYGDPVANYPRGPRLDFETVAQIL